VGGDTGEVVWDVPVLYPVTSESGAPQKGRDMQALPAEETATWTSFMRSEKGGAPL